MKRKKRSLLKKRKKSLRKLSRPRDAGERMLSQPPLQLLLLLLLKQLWIRKPTEEREDLKLQSK